MADPISQSLEGIGPNLTTQMEDLYGLRQEEFFRGIAPDIAQSIYGPRYQISPAKAAAMKLELAAVYTDLAAVSQKKETASLHARVKLAVAAISAAGKVQAAREGAEGKVAVAKVAGDMALAKARIPLIEKAMGEIGGGTLRAEEGAIVGGLVNRINEGTRSGDVPVPASRLFDSALGAQHKTLGAAQEAFLVGMDAAIKDLGTDKNAIRRVVIETANRTGSDVDSIQRLLVKRYETGPATANASALEALKYSEENPLYRIARLEAETRASIKAAIGQFAGGGATAPEANALIQTAIAAVEGGPAGVQVPIEALQQLNLTAEQMGDPNAVRDIQQAAADQVESLFKSINEGSEAIPYIQKQIDGIKRTAALEGSAFRDYLRDKGFNPDNPAHVEVGFGLLEEDYEQTRKYDTKEAKLIADTARLQRRRQRERAAEGQLDAGTVQAERRPEAMMPVEDELALMEQEALQQPGAAPAGAAPAGAEAGAPGRSEVEIMADLVQQGLLVEGTEIILLGKLPGDSVNEYALDAVTQEFIGIPPGKDATTGNRFRLGEELAKSNPTLTKALMDEGAVRVAKINKVRGVPDAAGGEAAAGEDLERLPGQTREGIGVRKSQTENMEIIEKQLRSAARDARKRGSEKRAKDLENRADKYLDLRFRVSYRKDEAEVQSVGEGFEQDEMLSDEEEKSPEEIIPEDVIKKAPPEPEPDVDAAVDIMDANTPVEAGEDPVEEVDGGPITDEWFVPDSVKAKRVDWVPEVGTSATSFSTPWRRKKAYDPGELSAEEQRKMGEGSIYSVPTTSALQKAAEERLEKMRKGAGTP